MTDTMKPSPTRRNAIDNPDIVQNVANFLSTAATIGILTAGGGEPTEPAKGIGNDENKPAANHTLKIATNAGVAVVGGGFAAAALAGLRKREEEQRTK